MLHCYPLVCLRNRQPDVPRINLEYSWEWRFLFKRNNGVSLSLHVIPLLRRCPQKTSPHNQQILPRNRVVSILGNMPIGSFKKRNDRLGKLSVSPCSKSRNGRRVIWEHRRGLHKNPLYSLNIAPTYLYSETVIGIVDYQGKAWFLGEMENS